MSIWEGVSPPLGTVMPNLNGRGPMTDITIPSVRSELWTAGMVALGIVLALLI